ncbi:S8 family peptidase [Companilactobacillus metriopterae]|uniref:S8 family peptidase n=1 Tax=Companilactobacillus metriopterae TaxID=1909267 RepID=UPI00100B5037|nr:S8 family serine peptidase [Companilactobacillus metriopterae]
MKSLIDKFIICFIFFLLLSNPVQAKSNDKLDILSDDFSTFNWSYRRVLNGGDYLNSKKNLLISGQGKGVKIALIDSGVDLNHSMLKDNVITQYNYTSDKNNSTDELTHGTQVMGIIDTLSPKSTVISYKVMNAKERDPSKTISAVYDAAEKNVDVINISSGVYEDITSETDKSELVDFQNAINFARQKNIFIVASAGNESEDITSNSVKVHAPGGLENVVTVAATTKSGLLASYSNYGSNISVSAPGGDYGNFYKTSGQLDAREMIMTYYPTDKESIIGKSADLPTGYTLSLGTSLAAPVVSSILADMISNQKEVNRTSMRYTKILKKLHQTAAPFSYYSNNGVGEVRLRK